MIPYLIPLVLVAAIIYNSIKILMEYERGVIFFLDFNAVIDNGGHQNKWDEIRYHRQLLIPLVLVAAIIYNSIKILMEYERGVIFFLGKFQTVKGPGLIIVILML